MRNLANILILVCCCNLAMAQPSADSYSERGRPTIDCGGFINLVNERKFQDAEAMLTIMQGNACNLPEVMLARAKLKAASFNFAEAEQILEKLVNQYPENRTFQNEWNHMVRLLSKAGEFQPVYVRPTVGITNGENVMIAWMNDTIPLLLKDQGTEPIYYPIRQEANSVMQFDLEEMRSRPDLVKITHRLQARRYEEIGPGTFLPDSSLIISSLERLPYASKSNAERMELIGFGADFKFQGPMSFANCKCNSAYPAYRSADSTVIFSSDREGGFGGMDLWKTKQLAGTWSEPINMGPEINSIGNEILATIAGDTLFYSSDKIFSGFGGYDLYGHRFSTGETWNLGLPINGPYDEHSMHVAGRGQGYLISNRTSSLSGSNIFKAKWTVIDQFFSELTGQISKAGDLTGMEVHLTSDDGAILQKGVIGADGKFSFKHIKGQETYRVEIPNADLPAGSRLQLFDEKEKLIQDITSTSKRGFIFVLLAPKDYIMERMAEEDESLLSVDIFGKLNKEEEGFKIILLDSDGEVVATTLTASDGKFKFESVKPDDRYKIQSEVKDAASAIHILDGNGELMQTIHPDESGGFVYVRLTPEDGVITITNEHNKKVRISNKDLFDLGVVKYDLNSTEILEESALILDQLATILHANPDISIHISGHTDAQGSDSYNLQLSEKRIQSAIKYMRNKGISRQRLSGTGYGETMILNHCVNDVECTEAEHAVNRRTEFRLRDSTK